MVPGSNNGNAKSACQENAKINRILEPYNRCYYDLLKTRKSKTEAVLQRRSIMKLGVICKFMNCYGKCFMS